jgi:hypothetical protein
MNLEQIDTSTTAGKAEVMRLAAEGRHIAIDYQDGRGWQVWGVDNDIEWNWGSQSFAIISEPVGPDEVWGLAHAGYSGRLHCHADKSIVEKWAEGEGGQVVRYIRADLAGEKGK